MQVAKKLKKASLIKKMLMLNIIGITSAMVLVLVLISVIYANLARQALGDEILVQAQLLATNVAPMMAFQDIEETKKLARAFHEIDEIKRIKIYDRDKNPIIDLKSEDTHYSFSQINNHYLNRDIDTTKYLIHSIVVYSPVNIEGESIGTVVIESSVSGIRKNLLIFVGIASLATLVGVALSVIILRKLQMSALRPIIEMSRLAERVATDKNYTLRVKIRGTDEIASLAVRFNQMLEKIESWDQDLNEEIDQRKESEKQLDYLARTDELTSLPNRLAFKADIDKAVKAANEADMPMAVMFIDLDDFKQVNDIHGHKHGDTVLQVTSKRITRILRDSDQLYRLGGDEFAALINCGKEDHIVVQICERIIEKVSTPIIIQDDGADKVSAKIGASIGIAFCPIHGDTTHDILHHADLAMYVAKNSGKNSYRIFDEQLLAN